MTLTGLAEALLKAHERPWDPKQAALDSPANLDLNTCPRALLMAILMSTVQLYSIRPPTPPSDHPPQESQQ